MKKIFNRYNRIKELKRSLDKLYKDKEDIQASPDSYLFRDDINKINSNIRVYQREIEIQRAYLAHYQ